MPFWGTSTATLAECLTSSFWRGKGFRACPEGESRTLAGQSLSCRWRRQASLPGVDDSAMAAARPQPALEHGHPDRSGDWPCGAPWLAGRAVMT